MAHIPRVLCPAPLQTKTEVELDAARAHHLYTVMRRRNGDTVRLWDGSGHESTGTLTQLDHRKGRVQVGPVEKQDRESPLALVLTQAVGRGDRFDDALVAAIEVGAVAIQPLWTEYGLPPMKAQRLEKKLRSWQQQILGAAEQAERSRLPELRAPMSFAAWLDTNPRGFVLHPGAPPLPQSGHAEAVEIQVAVGPEGGFSDREISATQHTALQSCSLGPRILRTEHAGPLAMAVLQAYAGDF